MTDVLAFAPFPGPTGLILSAEGAFVACVAAIVIDKMGLGGPKISFITDRIAFTCWVTTAAIGFNESGINERINGTISGAFIWLGTIIDVPLWEGGARVAPQLIGAIAALVAIGAMLPAKLSRWFGRWVTIQFSHLKQAGPGAAMPATGTTRGTAAPAAAGKGIFGKVFSGQINYGMVGLAFLNVAASTAVGGWIGQVIDQGINLCIGAVAWWANPLLASMGAS